MADILSLPDCGGAAGTFNTGIPLCDIIRGVPYGIIGLDGGVGFSSTDRATKASFSAKLKTLTRAPRGSRAYPFFKLTDFVDNSKAPTRAALGNLVNGETITNDGIPSFAFKHRIGEMFHQQLLAAQSAGLTWMIVDKKYAAYGTIDGSLFRGYSLSEFYVGLPKFASLSANAEYPFEMTLADISEYKENGRFVQLDSSIVSATGNRDVTLVLVNQTVNVLTVQAIGRGGKNLGDLFPAELAVVGAWPIVNTQTGASVTTTSVTYNSTSKAYIITADNTAYTALTTGQKFTVNLATPDVLAALALPVDGFESLGPVYIVKP